MPNSFKKQITTCIFLGIIFLAWIGEVYPQGDSDFPLPPESELLETKDLRLGGRDIQTFVYKSKVDQYNITEYYRKFFQDKEFDNLLDKREKRKDKQLLKFKKGELVFSLAIIPKPDGTHVVIAKYLEPAGSPPLESMELSVKDSLFALPQQDGPGKDLDFIPRPPESIRWLRQDLERRSLLTYATKLSVEEVVAFYKAQMPAQGWEFIKETATQQAVEAYKSTTGKKDLGLEKPFSDGEDLNQIINDSYVLDFKGRAGEVRLTIFPNFVDRKLGTLVQIAYSTETR
jgi:hypothetical protein